MSVLIHKDTKVIVQGITGKAARFHTEQMQKMSRASFPMSAR